MIMIQIRSIIILFLIGSHIQTNLFAQENENFQSKLTASELKNAPVKPELSTVKKISSLFHSGSVLRRLKF